MSVRERPPADDDLFAPTLGDRRPRPEGGARPWRLGSQVYVAFFGGALAITPIAAINAARLGLPRARIAAIVAIGVLAFAAALVAAGFVGDQRGGNALTRLPAVLGYLGMYLVQRQADRVYSWGKDDGEAYAGLWGAGTVAVIAGWIVQTAFVAGVAGTLA